MSVAALSTLPMAFHLVIGNDVGKMLSAATGT